MSERKDGRRVIVRKDIKVMIAITLKEVIALDQVARKASVSRSCYIRNAMRKELKMRALKKTPARSKWSARKDRRVYE